MLDATQSRRYGDLLLRVTLALVFLAHGPFLKIFVFTVPGTVAFFESIGLPGFLAYLVIAGETLGGLALLTGILVRPAALGLALISLGAAYPHLGNGWLFSNAGGGWEYPLVLAAASLAVALVASGDPAPTPERSA